MEIVYVGDGYAVKNGDNWMEGNYVNEQVANLAVDNLSEIDLSQLYLTVLSDGRNVITFNDYERYINIYKSLSY